jgi:hypothetical protein
VPIVVTDNIGGGTVKFSPDGTALSPAVTGFTGMGVDGVGWGTGVTLDKVWVTSFNGKIGLFDFEGRPDGPFADVTERAAMLHRDSVQIARGLAVVTDLLVDPVRFLIGI